MVLPGDANLDGFVDGDDVNILALNWNLTDRLFVDGDANGDGVVDGLDFSLLSSNYGITRQSLTMEGDLDGDWDVDDDDINVIALNGGMTGATRADGDSQVTEADLDLAHAQLGRFMTVVS